MKKSQKITFSGLMAAFAVAVMLAAYFPYVTYSIPAISGLAVMLVFMEAGTWYAFGTYIVSGILSIIFCEKEAAVLFVCFFGLYPIFKSYFERVKSRVLEWIIKVAFFNISAVISMAAATYVFGIPLDFGARWLLYAFWVLYNVFFIIYDFCLSKLSVLYFAKYRAVVRKIFGNIKK